MDAIRRQHFQQGFLHRQEKKNVQFTPPPPPPTHTHTRNIIKKKLISQITTRLSDKQCRPRSEWLLYIGLPLHLQWSYMKQTTYAPVICIPPPHLRGNSRAMVQGEFFLIAVTCWGYKIGTLAPVGGRG